jgi:hypothetical protein
MGLPLGYGYSWRIHGPYSTDSTTVAYQVILECLIQSKIINFKEPYAEMISRVNALEEKITKNELQISIVQWYELIASIAYWSKHGYVTKENLIAKIRATKPQFSEEQTSAAYDPYLTLKQAA